jgi:hypothetical protein
MKQTRTLWKNHRSGTHPNPLFSTSERTGMPIRKMPDRVPVNSSSNQPGSPSIGCHILQGTHRSPVPISRAACRLRPDPHEGEAAQLHIHIGWALGINTASKARQVSSRLDSSDGSRRGETSSKSSGELVGHISSHHPGVSFPRIFVFSHPS